jgi:hypothetical protein
MSPVLGIISIVILGIGVVSSKYWVRVEVADWLSTILVYYETELSTGSRGQFADHCCRT